MHDSLRRIHAAASRFFLAVEARLFVSRAIHSSFSLLKLHGIYDDTFAEQRARYDDVPREMP